MTTALQAQSNARNAQLSTGPTSEEGKARIAHNALRHGFCAADIVMPGEDRARFDALLHRERELWQPIDEDESELVDEIAASHWRRWRLRLAESQLWARRCGSGPDAVLRLGEALANDCDTTANAIEKLRRWWQGNERHLNRCEEKLRLLKRLAAHGGRVRAQAGPNPGFGRFLDAVIQRPMPSETPERVAQEIAKSAEQTQSSHPQPDQVPAHAEEAPAAELSRQAPAPAVAAEPRTRAERRRLIRAQKKAERRARRAGAGGAVMAAD